jgi:hypothetical protein
MADAGWAPARVALSSCVQLQNCRFRLWMGTAKATAGRGNRIKRFSHGYAQIRCFRFLLGVAAAPWSNFLDWACQLPCRLLALCAFRWL